MSYIPGTRIHFGHEKTVGQMFKRVQWERKEAREAIASHPGRTGKIVAKMHLRTARAYDGLIRKRMSHARRSR